MEFWQADFAAVPATDLDRRANIDIYIYIYISNPGYITIIFLMGHLYHLSGMWFGAT